MKPKYTDLSPQHAQVFKPPVLCHAKAGTGQDVSCYKLTPMEENHRGKLLKTLILKAMAARDNADVSITATLASSQVYRMQEACVVFRSQSLSWCEHTIFFILLKANVFAYIPTPGRNTANLALLLAKQI